MTDAPASSAGDAPATAEAPWSVALLARKLKDYIDRLGTVWAEGEITQWGVRNGNVYGKLKDVEHDVTVSFTAWSSTVAKFTEEFKQGDRVVALLKPDYWVKGGSLSFQVYQLRHVGLGDLLERLERLRRQLADEGLFAAERKKPLPFLPHCIGLITGKDSDAEKDVLRNAQLRWPSVNFRVRHTAVQGDRAAAEVAAAIRALDADPEVDVIIVARGGGDFQNLLVFSDETLVRTAAASETPIVSAIGHENDRPLLDDVADLRASTPTDAAKRIVPDVSEQRALVAQLRSRLTTRLTHRLSHDIAQLEQLRSRPALRSPETMLEGRAQLVWLQVSRGRELVDRALQTQSRRAAELRAALRALSPASTLARGYAIAHLSDGRIVRDAAQAPAGAGIAITVGRGSFAARSEGEIPETAADAASAATPGPTTTPN